MLQTVKSRETNLVGHMLCGNWLYSTLLEEMWGSDGCEGKK